MPLRISSGKPSISITDFGAVGNGVADDTAAIQRAVNYALAQTYKPKIDFPPGNYLLTASIKLSGVNVTDMKLVGDRLGTTFTQSADNEPIFELTATSFSHTNFFSQFNAVWNTASSAAKTRRAFLLMPSTGNTDFYNNSFEHITCDLGNYVFYSVGPSFWGNRVIDILAGTGMTGGIAYMVPDHTTGQPNNYFEKHYCQGRLMTGPVYKGAASDVKMVAIEFNELNQGPKLIEDFGGGSWSIQGIRLENGTYATANLILIDNRNGATLVDYMEIYGNSMLFNANTFIFNLNNVDGRVFCRELNLTPLAGSTGVLRAFAGAANLGRCVIDTIKSAVLGTLVALTNNASSGGADAVIVSDWSNLAIRRFNADADLALTYADAPTQVFPTAPAADRNVLLPSVFDDNIFTGRPFRIVKDAAGAGAINIKTSAGVLLYTIPAASVGSVEFRYNRTMPNATARTWSIDAISYV